jgi:hypothetical protein
MLSAARNSGLEKFGAEGTGVTVDTGLGMLQFEQLSQLMEWA